MNDVTKILSAIEQGETSAVEELLPLVYDELRRLASVRLKHEKPGQTLQATALVHEAFIRLVDANDAQRWNSRGHFFGAAAEAMRRILVEQARRKNTLKSGGNLKRVQLAEVELAESGRDVDIVALDAALNDLAAHDPRAAQIVQLRFFAGLTAQQTADALQVSKATADTDWAYARSWLRTQLSTPTGGSG